MQTAQKEANKTSVENEHHEYKRISKHNCRQRERAQEQQTTENGKNYN